MLTSLPPKLAHHASQQSGVFTTAQALRAGIAADEITMLVRRGQWTRLRRGSYVSADTWAGATSEQRHRLRVRAVALALRAPTVVSHHSAAVLHGLRLHQVPLDVVHVTHPRRRGSSRAEADVRHHEAELTVADTVHVSGLRVTSPVRTTIDCARVLPLASGLAMADGVLAGGVSHAQLFAMYERQLDWPGSRGASRVVSSADGRSDSVGETLGRLVFDTVGMAPTSLQFEIVTDAGVFRTDYAWLAQKVVGEFDGRIKYGRLLRPGESTQDVVMRERARELAIERAGWIVVRFTWAELQKPELVYRRLKQAFARAQRFAS